MRRRKYPGDERQLTQEGVESRSKKLVMVQLQGRCVRTGEKGTQGEASYRHGSKKQRWRPWSPAEVG